MKYSEALNEMSGGVVGPDETGSVTLLFDGKCEVTFSPVDDEGVLFQCEVGDADRLGEGGCRALLEASYSETGGAAFAIHRALGKVILWTRHGEFSSTAEKRKAVDDFLGHAIEWKGKLANGGFFTAPEESNVPSAGMPGEFLVV